MGSLSTFTGIIGYIISSSWFVGIIVTGGLVWALNYFYDITFEKKSVVMIYSAVSIFLYLIMNR